MSERSQLIEKLESAHTFPGPYTFRIIGNNHADLPAAVEKALSNLVIQELTKKLSKNNNHLALKVKVIAPTPESVLDAYALLSALELVRYVL